MKKHTNELFVIVSSVSLFGKLLNSGEKCTLTFCVCMVSF